MDYVLIVFGAISMILGFIGGIIPILPGPPLSYVGLLLLHFTGRYQFSTRFLIIWLIITVVVYSVDYVVPAWGAKKFGGSKRGVWGSIIGLFIGIFILPSIIVLGPFGLFGIILGPFIGAVVGELTSGKDSSSALIAGFGSFVGFIFGTLLKLTTSAIMAWFFIKELIG